MPTRILQMLFAVLWIHWTPSIARASASQNPSVAQLLEQAYRQAELGPENPRVWLLRGISNLYKPKLFGGGTAKAEQDLQQAVRLFAKNAPAAPAPSWGHAEAYVLLGQLYARDKQVAKAQAAYDRALELDPGLEWVGAKLVVPLTGK